MRRRRIGQLSQCLGSRPLYWFGVRGSDPQSLLELEQFRGVYSMIAPLGAVSIEREVCLETLRGERVDHNRYSIDADHADDVERLRDELKRAMDQPCALVTYRPSAFLASAYFPRAGHVNYLGVFHELQSAFEHKPWVETALRDLGVRVIPWSYYDEEDLGRLKTALHGRALVLRAARSLGGTGFGLVEGEAELLARWPPEPRAFVASAPFLHEATPLNVNACVFPGGEVAIHPSSLQLIGIAECTPRRFGYCGNDFRRIRDLDDHLLDELDDMARRVGRWLWSRGYLGAFGIDAVVYDGKVHLAELNPRFQGSTLASTVLDRDSDRSDQIMDHVSAFLGLPAPDPISVRDLAAENGRLSQVICYNQSNHAVTLRPDRPPMTVPLECQVRALPAAGVRVAPGGMLFHLFVEGSVTADGFALDEPVRRVVTALLGQFEECLESTS